jgi:hypothetical protein
MRRKGVRRTRRIDDELERRGYHHDRSSPVRAGEGRKSPKPPNAYGVSRRQFMRYGVGTGMMAGLPSLLQGPSAGRIAPGKPGEVRTLFFNLSHENFSNKQYYLVAGGNKFPLTRVIDKPAVLALACLTNGFLKQIPKTLVTHHLENVEFPANAVQLCYITSDEDKTTGRWKMSSMFVLIPSTAIATAYVRGTSYFGGSARPLSAKRKKYGLTAPAGSAIELLDEHALIDITDHAAAMVGMHPEILSVEPGSAAHIHENHIAPSPFTSDLSDDIGAAGAAQPQLVPGQPNAFTQGWATLRPFTDENNQPLRSTKGNNAGLIQYNAEWEPTQIAVDASSAITGVLQSTKDDETLGRNVTPISPASGNGQASKAATPPDPQNLGAIWLRRDGVTSVVQSPHAPARVSGSFNFTLVPSTPQAGYHCTARVDGNPNGTPHITLNFENTYLRWLGVYIQFYDGDKVVPVSSLPVSLRNAFGPSNDDQAMFVGILTPEFVLYGIPVQSSILTADFDFPTGVASSAKILAGGLGAGSHTFPATEAFGETMTILFNLITPAIMMASASAQNLDPLIKLGVIPAVNAGLQEFFAFLEDLSGDTGYTNLLNIFVRALDRAGFPIVVKLAELIDAAVMGGEAEDLIPIAGQIIAAIGILGALAEIVETSAEVATSPWTYEYDLALTHDLSVTIKHAIGNTTTPKDANHYKVTALFDSGATPRVVEADLPRPQDQIVVTFTDVPLGGNVNVSAAFSQVPANLSQDHVLLGKATTGLVSNAGDILAAVNIREFKYPIGPSTRYLHSEKTALDSSGHVWLANAPAPVAKASDITCQQEGDLCDFYAITVRQGRATDPGYVGYAWRGNSAGIIDCYGQGQSDSGQLANLNTDTTNGGHNAQSGYAKLACGLRNKPRLAYSMLAHPTANYYLDTTNKVVRRISLDSQSQFDDPRSNEAWGAFILESTSLLLHPTGKLVSVNRANHKLETLTLADASMSDADAKVKRLALAHSGQGSRPGLLKDPVAAAISPDGVVLVLEQENNRIQAFDTDANAVPYFTKQSTKYKYFLNLTATRSGDTVYLDLAVEYTGFIYVLSYNLGTNIYRLDIYHPAQAGTQPIATTVNVNAARITVDFWRNVYTLNYEVLQSSTGNAEPSVSLWLPSNAS